MNKCQEALKMKRGLLLAAFLIFSCPVLAADYYVSTGGSDSNSGSSGSPWRTIQKAANTAKAGDTVYVKEGTYNERVSLSKSGTSGNKISFISSPRRTATAEGFDISGDNIRVEGFQITSNSNSNGINIYGDYAEVLDNYLYNIRKRGIQSYDPVTSFHIADNHIFHSQKGMWIEGEDGMIENNEIERLYNYGTDDVDYVNFFGTNHVFRNNYFHGSRQDEIGGAHMDCYQTWGPKEAAYILFEKNICTTFHNALMTEPEYDKTHHLTFMNNIFYNGKLPNTGMGYGLYVKGLHHITATNNVFAEIRNRCILIQNDNSYEKYALIKNNIFYNSATSYTFSGSTSFGDYNLIYNTHNNPNTGPHDIIGVDPLFVNPDNGDFSLKAGSPACGAGEDGVDIGAIPCGAGQSCTGQGYYCCPSGRTCSQPKSGSGCGSGDVCCASQNACAGGSGLTGDLNSDGKVDIFDLVLVAQNFGMTSGFDSRADANGDSRVDIFDLVVVAQNFGRTS